MANPDINVNVINNPLQVEVTNDTPHAIPVTLTGEVTIHGTSRVHVVASTWTYETIEVKVPDTLGAVLTERGRYNFELVQVVPATDGTARTFAIFKRPN